MKKNYISPKAIVCEMATDDAILTAVSPGLTTSGFGTNSNSGVKAEFGSDIDMSEVGGNAVGWLTQPLGQPVVRIALPGH